MADEVCDPAVGVEDMRLAAITWVLALTFSAVAHAQMPEQQQIARDRMFGTGDEVRWRTESVPAIFASDSWPLRASGATVENRGLRHASLPVWVPLSTGPCRLFFFSPIPTGPGGGAAWLCRLDQPVPFFQFSFESRRNEHAALVSELTLVDETGLGVQAAQCRDVEAIGGADRQSWCESTFTLGTQADAGRLIVVIGSTDQFFFKATTACAGAQCEPTRAALQALLSEVQITAAE
ncbi:MAG: hypothetical protein KJZ75_11980 [Hyphomonadaceae bacterium]|nr:hypothetical protein [Hyphomonadaceae bacterium]